MSKSSAGTKTSMLKVIYFDESSATDYLCIYSGGTQQTTKEDIEQKAKELAGKAGIGLFAKLSWLPFLGGEGETSLEAGYSKSGTSLIQTTLSNTVLTDFIETANPDNRIHKMKNCKVRPAKNSIAYFKSFTPYLTIAKSEQHLDDGTTIDISQLDEAFLRGKGYYEMLVDGPNKQSMCIFRFNINAFRNNYNIADLIKMDMEYYVIKVGSALESELPIEKEFAMMIQEKHFDAIDVIDGNEGEGEGRLDVFDVILAGVSI